MLHQYDWSESSLILDLFTRDSGRVVAAAKGAKRPYSQLRPVLLPFQRLTASMSRSRADDPDAGEVQTLRHAEWAGGPVLPAGAVLFAGFYLNELVMRLVPRHDPHPALFDTYAAALERLASRPGASSATLRAFELALLREIGLLPELSVETPSQQPVRPEGLYELRPELGVVQRHDDTGGLDRTALAGQQLLALDAALAARDVDFGRLAEACSEGVAALKASLQPLVHYHLGTSTLRTREVLRGLQGLVAPAAAAGHDDTRTP